MAPGIEPGNLIRSTLIRYPPGPFFVTVERPLSGPPLSGPPLSGHTLLNSQMSKCQKYLVYIIKDKTSTERPPLLSGRGHLRVVPSSVF